jgi:hypothetical protein
MVFIVKVGPTGIPDLNLIPINSKPEGIEALKKLAKEHNSLATDDEIHRHEGFHVSSDPADVSGFWIISY